MTKKNNTNKKSKKNITISQILEKKDDDCQFYRDILLYVLLKYKGIIKGENDDINAKQEKIDDDSSETEFRVWELSKWLLKNNHQLRDATQGSHQSTYSKTHSKIQSVSSSLNNLIELDLVFFSREAKSLRNPTIPTKIYDVSPLGMLVASIVEFKTFSKGTSEYKEASKSLLELWINYISQGNKDWNNYHYYFLEGLVKKSLESHDELLLSFIEYIRDSAPDLFINFGELRYKVNNVIFKKLISDEKFTELCFSWLNEYCRKNLTPDNTRELIKFQFKLDVETQYERSLSQLLNFPSDYIKTFQWDMKQNIEAVQQAIKQNKETFQWDMKQNIEAVQQAMEQNRKKFTYKKVKESGHFHKINLEIVFDYNLKNQWEQIRNKNLLNFDKITILMKCTKCGSIYPLPLEIWNETEGLTDHIHKYGSMVKIYDLKNDTNAQYLNVMLSAHKE